MREDRGAGEPAAAGGRSHTMLSGVREKGALAWLLAVLLAGAAVEARFWSYQTKGEDVYYSWLEGRRILGGENPYARIHGGDMLTNQKYSTYFPLFYELSALSQGLGLREYSAWISFWRMVFVGFSLAITAALFILVYPCAGLPGALLAAAFWQFGRWTLYVARVAHIDFIAIFFLVLSLALVGNRRRASPLLLGVSLAIKQIGVFLAPLYLVWAWQEAAERRALRETAASALLMAAVPLLSSLPFLAVDASGYVKSLLFSATRLPFGSALSVDQVLGWEGLPARLPMAALMLLAYWVAWKRTAGRYAAVLFVLAIFLGFNPVLFPQYHLWAVPLIPLLLCEQRRPPLKDAS